MLYAPIQLEEKSALSRAGRSISAIVLSTMESPARDQEAYVPSSSLRSFGSEESYGQTPRHETDLSNQTQESEATTKGILGERNHNGETQLGLPQTDHGSDSRSVHSIGQYKQISQDLKNWQIFFIVISGTIGLGLFVDTGEILRIAGPGGGLLAICVVGIGVILLMAGVAEMINHWPISGALVEFVRTFVDNELGIVLGIAYWLAYSITFGTLLSALVDLGRYWNWPGIWQAMAFCIGSPILILFININGVYVYGFIESIAGAIKLLLVFGSLITMFVINNAELEGEPKIGSKYISQGFQADSRITTSPFVAILAGIPIATYAYAGVEIVAVTALEAKDSKAVRWPAYWVPRIIFVTYALGTLGFYLNVSWENPLLPSISKRATGGTTTGASILIIAARKSAIPHLAGFLNVTLILTVLSSANTALYVASRTLYGLTREFQVEQRAVFWKRWISELGTTHHTNNVPIKAVLTSFVLFGWLPAVHIARSDQSFQEILSGIATVSVVLVWSAQCLAFIRYRKWLSKHPNDLHTQFEKFSSKGLDTGYLSHFQPLPAYLGLIGCLVTVVGFSTASWWEGGSNATSVLAAFLLPALLVLFWTCLKIASPDPTFSSFGFGVNLSGDFSDLRDVITKLDGMICKPEPEPASLGSRSGGWEIPINNSQAMHCEANSLNNELQRDSNDSHRTGPEPV
ncbi:hypothetical protein GLAREA_07426 [Glarea lozoyensis ATCC 20868]|uniref:Amino acid permease/ SLC12A domain-containing protein n=1 Tax=Glarea lozoyensis (strain ATCC 20868 / MF5171) TaxID=1116229 RepID=S3E1E8_GLAL2|nr:uncharacterized protein GLAREA_07426 [Glarea lozoyensis ATCC 20868]EPE32293.1 hypothetical protein GLAREA_07426 [Glarea lozoyensis ATCC 20868]